MVNVLDCIVESVPELVKNTHVDVKLEGWPAAIAISSLAIGFVSGTALLTYYKYSYPEMVRSNSQNPKLDNIGYTECNKAKIY